MTGNYQSLVAERGCDSNENNKFLWDEYGIKPVIEIKGGWREETEKLADSEYADNIAAIWIRLKRQKWFTADLRKKDKH